MKREMVLLVSCAAAACGVRPLNRDDGGIPGTAGMAATAGAAGSAGTAATAGAAGTAGAGGSRAGASYEVTRWRVPFADSEPFQIAAVDSGVVYLNKGFEQHLGLLDVGSDTVTEWPLPYTSTSPGGIEVRPSDGRVFVAGATQGEIGEFDLRTQVLRRWKLPLDDSRFGAGPWTLAFDTDGRVYFGTLELDIDDSPTVIGRLDTTTGQLAMWTFPDHVVPRVNAGPDGTVVFNVWGSAPHQQGIARLDTGTGVFSFWPLTSQLEFSAVADSAGNLFVLGYVDAAHSVIRLAPATGLLTQWPMGGQGADCLRMLAGRVYYGRPDIASVEALDPAVAGRDTLVTATVHPPVTPRLLTLSPTMVTLIRQQAQTERVTELVHSEVTGAFESWPLGGSPRMIATVPGVVYVTEDFDRIIARITLGAP
jgi:streptogramin lyase